MIADKYRYKAACVKKALKCMKHFRANTQNSALSMLYTAKIKHLHIYSSSLIQTILSVLESHQILRHALADFTADREFHPAPKTAFIQFFFIIMLLLSLCKSFFAQNPGIRSRDYSRPSIKPTDLPYPPKGFR